MMRGAASVVALCAAMMACGGGDETTAPPDDASADASLDTSDDAAVDVADTAVTVDSSAPDVADATATTDASDSADVADTYDAYDAYDASDTADTSFDAGPITTLRILGLADFQGQLEPLVERDSAASTDSSIGGLGLLAKYVEEERAAEPNTVLVTAGDAFGATPPLSLYGAALADQAAIESLDHLAVDFAAIGHHELDRGVGHLRALKELASFRFVASNLDGLAAELDASGATKTVAAPYATKVVGGLTVAFVGITNADAPSFVVPGSFGSIVVKEPIAEANAAAAAARTAGAQVVVAIAHLGAKGTDGTGAPTGPLVDLAKGLTGIDLVVGAHTGAVIAQKFAATTVVQPGARGRSYGRATVRVQAGTVIGVEASVVPVIGLVTHVFDAGPACTDADKLTICASQKCVYSPAHGGGRCVVECATTPCPTGFTCDATSQACRKTVKEPSAAAEAKLVPYRTALAAKLDVTIGKAAGTFSGGSVSAYPERKDETALGDLVADAMLARYAPLGARIALTSVSPIESSIPAAYSAPGTLVRFNCGPSKLCDLVYGDVYTAFRGERSLVLRKVTGDALWAVLEQAYSALPLADARFPQMAGLRVEIQASAAAGNRVRKVTIVDPSKTCPADACDSGFTCDVGLSRCTRDVPKVDATEYVVVTTEIPNAGGDGWTAWREPWPTPSVERLADVFLAYVETKTLTPSVAGRLVRLP